MVTKDNSCLDCGKTIWSDGSYCLVCARKGERNPFYGKVHTKETKKKISIKRKKQGNWGHNGLSPEAIETRKTHGWWKNKEATAEKIRQNIIQRIANGQTTKMLNQETSIERLIENRLLFNNIVYIKQFKYKLGVADFWLPETNIIIECDGDYWHNLPVRRERDKVQVEWLENNGYIVYRFWEKDIRKDAQRCIKSIVEVN